MDTIKNIGNTIHKIISVLEKGKISNSQYRSTEQIFFTKDDNNNDFEMKFKTNANNYIKEIPIGLNRNIILIYKILNNPDIEIYLGEWVIFSLKQSLEIYEDYCNNNQRNVFDIAFRYRGMGRIEALSCDLNTHLLFLREDGGSNGYERFDNYNKVINNGSSNYKQFYFSNWFYSISFYPKSTN